MEPSYPAIDFLSMCSQESCFLGQRVWLSDFVEGLGSVTNETPKGSRCRFPWIPVPTKGSSPFSGLAVPPGPRIAPGSPPSMARSLGLSLDGGRRPRHIETNFPPFHSHRTSSWHKKCQSTGDWLNNWDLVSSFKIKITRLQIATRSLNNTAQIISGIVVPAVAPSSQVSHMH